MDVKGIQSALRDAGPDGWLFYDHHHCDVRFGRDSGIAGGLLVAAGMRRAVVQAAWEHISWDERFSQGN